MVKKFKKSLILLPNFRKPNAEIFQENLYLHYPRESNGNEMTILSIKYTLSLHYTPSPENVTQKLDKTIYTVEVLHTLF